MTEPIRLDKADYFELKALILQAELAKAQTRQVEAAAQAKLAALVSAEGGDPNGKWGLDEASLSLVAG